MKTAMTGVGVSIGGSQPENKQTFPCSCCKRDQVYSQRYQCTVCEDISLCKLCFGVNYHKQHDFLLRPAPNKDWEPVFRNGKKKTDEEYRKIMEELEAKDELTPDDYDLMLELEK